MRHTFLSKPSRLACGIIAVTLAAVTVGATSLVGQTTGSSDQLQQLTAQLQRSPGDQALREQIIALALTLNPTPATPDGVSRAEGAAEYAFTHAQAKSDFADAAKQYEKALLLAPWLAADYFNCGVAHEKAGANKEAIRSFTLYLLAAPTAVDAQAVNKRIGGLQYAAQKAEDEAHSPQAQLEKFFKSLDGGVWRCDHDIQRSSDGSRGENFAAGHTYLAVSGRIVSYSEYYKPTQVNGAMGHWNNVDYEPTTPPDWTVTLTSQKFA